MSQLTQPFSSRNAILAFITPPLAPAPPPPPDQLIELAIVVHRQGCECLIGQACRVGASAVTETEESSASDMVSWAYGPGALCRRQRRGSRPSPAVPADAGTGARLGRG